MTAELVLPLLGSLLAVTVTGLFGYLVARNGRSEKREDRESAADLALAELLDKRVQIMLDRLGQRVDELEVQAKEDRATIHGLEVEVATLRRENATLRAQLARLTGLAAAAEADTAGGDDD